MKKHWPLFLILLILLLGVGVLFYPRVSNLLSKLTSTAQISSYKNEVESLDTAKLQEKREQAEAYNRMLGQLSPEVALYQNTKEDEGSLEIGEIMGYLNIPKIKVYLAIYEKTDKASLQKGVCHLKNTSLPVGGKSSHCVLSGHTGLPSAALLTDLDQMEKGDTFYLHVLNEVYAYQVDQIKVVLPEQTEDLKIVYGEDYTTLITCTPYGINSHRLLVRGVRIPYTPREEKIANRNGGIELLIDHSSLVWIFTVGSLLLFIVIIVVVTIWKWKQRRR